MDNDKNSNPDAPQVRESGSNEKGTRARNRTVMLTPEITGQVRARFQQSEPEAAPPMAHISSGASLEDTLEEYDAPLDEPVREPIREALQEPVREPFRSPETRNNSYGIQPTRGPISHTPIRQEVPSVTVRAPAAEPEPVRDGIVWTSEGPVIGFLVSFDANPLGDVVILRPGRVIVTSQPQQNGSYLLIRDETVSPLHAIMRISNTGEIQILDQLSEFGTSITRCGTEEVVELSGDKSTVEHGDTVHLGKRLFHVCMVSRHLES